MFQLSNKAKILILFANAYDMQDDRGRAMQGCSVHYLFWGENGEQLFPHSELDNTRPVGVQRAKVSMDFALRSKVPVAPALYEGEFITVVGGDGKPVLKLQDVSYISDILMFPRILPGMAVPGMVSPENVPSIISESCRLAHKRLLETIGLLPDFESAPVDAPSVESAAVDVPSVEPEVVSSGKSGKGAK